MPPPYEVPSSVYLFHITHLDNLRGILLSKGLMCKKSIQKQDGGYVNVAYNHIQGERASKRIPCGPGGTLHDYVPFHFGPRPPMLLPISSGRVPGYGEGQTPILHLVVQLKDIITAGLPFVFSDGHGIKAYTQFYTELDRLDQVDFPLMKERFWNDTNEDPNRTWRRNAEFLVHKHLPWSVVKAIAVINNAMKTRTDAILREHQTSTLIAIKPGWYY